MQEISNDEICAGQNTSDENPGGAAARRHRGCWSPCHRSDSRDAVGWAAIFIWAGLVLLAETTGYARNFASWDGWAVFLTGAGLIILTGTSIRMLQSPRERPARACGLVFGLVLLSIGLGDTIAWLWPLLLLGLGLTILRGALAHQP